MRFHLTIDCDNAAFLPDNDTLDPEIQTTVRDYAVARILQDASCHVRRSDYRNNTLESQPLRDSNGNTVGRYWWSEEGSAEA